MKRIILFVLLKVVEIGGFIFVFTGCSAFGNILPIKWIDETDIVWTRDVGSFIACGIYGAMLAFLVSIALIILYYVAKAIIEKNWEWTGRFK